MLLFGAIAVFAAIFCLVYGLVSRPETQVSARLAGLRGERPDQNRGRASRHESLSARVLLPLADSFGGKLERLLPSRFMAGIERRLLQAGQPATLGGFLVASLIFEGVLVGFGLTLVAASGAGGSKAPPQKMTCNEPRSRCMS